VHCPPNSSLVYSGEILGRMPSVGRNMEAVRDVSLENVEILLLEFRMTRMPQLF